MNDCLSSAVETCLTWYLVSKGDLPKLFINWHKCSAVWESAFEKMFIENWCSQREAFRQWTSNYVLFETPYVEFTLKFVDFEKLHPALMFTLSNAAEQSLSDGNNSQRVEKFAHQFHPILCQITPAEKF